MEANSILYGVLAHSYFQNVPTSDDGVLPKWTLFYKETICSQRSKLFPGRVESISPEEQIVSFQKLSPFEEMSPLKTEIKTDIVDFVP